MCGVYKNSKQVYLRYLSIFMQDSLNVHTQVVNAEGNYMHEMNIT